MRAALALALLLGACAGPRPLAPEGTRVVPPSGWRDAMPGAEVDPVWWIGFGDPALGRMVEAALADNVDIAIAASRVEEARARFRLANGARLPGVSASAGGGEQRDLDPFGRGVTQEAGQGQVSIAWDLDLFGRLAQASAAARAQLLASAAARDAVRLAVAASAAEGYITLRALDARLVILRDTLAARAEALRIARRRAETGYTSRLELRQAEAEYRSAEQLIPATELAIRRQEDGLSVLLGEAPRAIERGNALDRIATPPVAAMLPARLLRRRPDIAQAEQQLVAADRSLDSARAAFMPNIQLGATGGFVAAELLPDPVSVFTLGGSILAPIFQGGRLRAQADIAAAARDQAAWAYRRVVLTAFQEVEDALAAVARSAEQEQALIAQRDALAAALAHAEQRYRAGYSPYLEQLDAQRGLLNAELSLVQIRADRLVSAVRLYRAIGGGWAQPIERDAGRVLERGE